MPPRCLALCCMKKIETPYLLFALVFGFMALLAPYLMEEHRLTLEGRVAMLLFQAGMVFACSLATAKHLHDKWVQEDIADRQSRLRIPRSQDDEASHVTSNEMPPTETPPAQTPLTETQADAMPSPTSTEKPPAF